MSPSKMMIALAALVASASAFSPAPAFSRSVATRLAGQKADWETAKELGWSMGGQDHTRNPDAVVDEDPRKSIKAAPTFEEYMKQRQAQGN